MKNKQLSNLFNDFDKIFSNDSKELLELEAIWFDEKVNTNFGKQIRLAPDMNIRVVEGEIQKDATDFNCTIKACYGTITSSELYLLCYNFVEKEEIIITVKAPWK